MTTYETYQARADSARASALAATQSPYTIEVRFLGGLTDTQKEAFTAAADRWARMIVGDLPSVLVDGEVIDDLLILAQGAAIDGTGNILGQAGPTHLRPASASVGAQLPAKGTMTFDTADLEQMEAKGTLHDVITHEMGHVIGLGGFVWKLKNLLQGETTDDPVFVGQAARAEYAELLSSVPHNPSPGNGVPVENTGGAGTRNSHWRESVFHNELMTGIIAGPGNPLSSVTVASMQDLGYQVDLNAAEPYSLPHSVTALTADELSVPSHQRVGGGGIVLPVIPQELPADSLR